MRFPLRVSISRRSRRRVMGQTDQTAGLFFSQANTELQEPPPTVELPNIGTWGDGQQTIGDGIAGSQPGNGTGNGTGNNTPQNGGTNLPAMSGDEGDQGQHETGSADGLLNNAGNPDNNVINGVPVMPLGQPAPAVVTHATANGNNHPALSVTLAEGGPNNTNQPDNTAANTGADANMPLGKSMRARAYLALRLDKVAAMVLRLRDRLRGPQTANGAQPSALANATGTLGVPE